MIIIHKSNRFLIHNGIRTTALAIFFLFLWACLSAGPATGTAEAGSDSFEARVKYVIDGDTVILDDDRHVRYIGINTPEIAHKYKNGKKKGEPFGKAAKKRNRYWVAGKRVRLEFDRERKDRYGRVLAYVYLSDGTLVNEKLVEEGMAWCLYDKKNSRLAPQLLKRQRRAMKAEKGLWRSVSRKKERLIGNRNSRRFHLSSCVRGKQISKRNRKVFNSRWDAFWEGYSPAGGCIGGKGR